MTPTAHRLWTLGSMKFRSTGGQLPRMAQSWAKHSYHRYFTGYLIQRSATDNYLLSAIFICRFRIFEVSPRKTELGGKYAAAQVICELPGCASPEQRWQGPHSDRRFSCCGHLCSVNIRGLQVALRAAQKREAGPFESS